MKAIALISGGLDSILAARVVKEEGIEVIPVHFKIPFCHLQQESNLQSLDRLIKEVLGMDLKKIDIGKDFLGLIENPRHGFGANMNPCIDCKILMLSKAKELLPSLDASFVVTGEVLGQRPMSQNKPALNIIAKKSGLEGLVLRPLSAKVLAETMPEAKGWISRARLLNFSGRTRKPQIALADKYKIKGYAQPAGGCLLTYKDFSKRLADLMNHKILSLENVELLKFGRHFRLSPEAKLVVGRNEKENNILFGLAQANDYLFFPQEDLAGPHSLGRGCFSPELIRLACGITRYHCDLKDDIKINIFYRRLPEKEKYSLAMKPYVDSGQIDAFRI